MPDKDSRIVVLRAAVVAGGALVVVTEVLGFFHLLVPAAVAVFWLLAVAAAAIWLRPRRPAIGLWEWLLPVPVLAIVALLGWVAWLASPNSYDAMGYHLPRVVMWVQHASLDNFATT